MYSSKNVFREPGGIRTHDPQLRRLLLYPAELLVLPYCKICFASAKVMISFYFAKFRLIFEVFRPNFAVFSLDCQALGVFFRRW